MTLAAPADTAAAIFQPAYPPIQSAALRSIPSPASTRTNPKCAVKAPANVTDGSLTAALSVSCPRGSSKSIGPPTLTAVRSSPCALRSEQCDHLHYLRLLRQWQGSWL